MMILCVCVCVSCFSLSLSLFPVRCPPLVNTSRDKDILLFQWKVSRIDRRSLSFSLTLSLSLSFSPLARSRSLLMHITFLSFPVLSTSVLQTSTIWFDTTIRSQFDFVFCRPMRHWSFSAPTQRTRTHRHRSTCSTTPRDHRIRYDRKSVIFHFWFSRKTFSRVFYNLYRIRRL